jgi:hypothetical protein
VTPGEELETWRNEVRLLARNKWLPSAGRCSQVWSRDKGAWRHTIHLNAPRGASQCNACDRVVLRGMGRWWG